MKAMILAAGLGTRLRPVTEKFAKPAVPFLNVPLLYYPISLLEEAGLDHLVINTHHMPDQVERLAHSIPGFDGRISISHEPGEPLGSGGGIWKARPFLEGSGDFLVSNGDEVILPHDPHIMEKLLADHRGSGALATILVMRHPLVGTQFGGVWANAEGFVQGFGKDVTRFAGCTGYHYIGIQVLNDRVFQYLPEGESNILYDALVTGIQAGESVRVVVGEFTWFETGNPKDFLEATHASLRLLHEKPQGCHERDFLEHICRRFWRDGQRDGQRNGQRRQNLFVADNAQIPAGAIAPGCEILVGSGALVKSGAQLKGFVVLGEDCVIESGATVENSVVLPNSKVSDSLSGSIKVPGTFF